MRTKCYTYIVCFKQELKIYNCYFVGIWNFGKLCVCTVCTACRMLCKLVHINNLYIKVKLETWLSLCCRLGMSMGWKLLLRGNSISFLGELCAFNICYENRMNFSGLEDTSVCCKDYQANLNFIYWGKVIVGLKWQIIL